MQQSILTFFKHLFSFETAFVLFLFSYQYKNAHPIFLHLDITLALIGVLLPWALFIKYKTKQPFFTKDTIPLLLFTGWCIASAFWAPKSSYTISKTLCFVVYTVPSFFMGYSIIGSNPERLKRFLMAVLTFAVIVHLEAYRTFYHANGWIVDVLGNNYLVAGQTLGCGFILLVVFSLFQLMQCHSHGGGDPDTKRIYSFMMLLCGTFSFIQLNLGGRGPVVAVFLVTAAFYLYGMIAPSSRRIYLPHFLHLVLVCSASYWLLKWMLSADTFHFIARTQAFINTPNLDDPVNWRIGYYKSAITVFLNHPLLGVGFGGWVNYHEMGSLPWQHPHNIVLEVLSETGMIGGVLGAWFSFNVLKSVPFQSLKSSYFLTASFFLLLFSFLNALKSGDLNDNLLLFVMAGIVLRVSKQAPAKAFPQ